MLFTEECAEKVLEWNAVQGGIQGRSHILHTLWENGGRHWHNLRRRMGSFHPSHGDHVSEWPTLRRLHHTVLMQGTQLCEHVMTGMLIQFKRRIRSGTVAGYSIDQADSKFFPKTVEKCSHGSTTSTSHRPYVSLIMELGVQPKLHEKAQTRTKFKSDSSSCKKKPRPQTPPSNEGVPDHTTPSKVFVPELGQRYHPPSEGHARYNVFAYGCSPSVYRGIDAAHKASYALLLSSRDFLGEHPRKDVQTLKAVWRMKPFWNGGEDCYHWVEHDNILHGPVSSPKVEFGVGNQM